MKLDIMTANGNAVAYTYSDDYYKVLQQKQLNYSKPKISLNPIEKFIIYCPIKSYDDYCECLSTVQ